MHSCRPPDVLECSVQISLPAHVPQPALQLRIRAQLSPGLVAVSSHPHLHPRPKLLPQSPQSRGPGGCLQELKTGGLWLEPDPQIFYFCHCVVLKFDLIAKS